MANTAAVGYPESGTIFGTPVPKLWSGHPRPTRFGDIAVVAFLVSQFLDGIFTYVGVVVYGPGVEANPVIVALMIRLGHGPALIAAKTVAASLGIMLHLRGIHAAVAVLVCFYLAAAILPWIAILFF